MMVTSINNMAVALRNAKDFEASLTTTTTATILNSATSVATTVAINTAATYSAANTSAINTYASSSNISTILSDPRHVSR